MDILTHALSGIAVASCSSSFIKPNPTRKAKILFAGMIGGMFPDIDAISMWSKFDSSLGKIFNLSDTGRVIYSSKLWYSHHAFLHSLLGSLFIALLFMLIMYFANKLFNKRKLSLTTFGKSHFIYAITFILAFWAHLLGDLPTPSSTWGGIALLWPSLDYVGGYGKIWWWNNYDIFLIILSCIIINLGVPTCSKYIKDKSRVFTSTIISLGFILILIQINTRKYDYAYIGHTTKYAKMEAQSKEEQKRILGKRVYSYMEWFDNKLKFYF